MEEKLQPCPFCGGVAALLPVDPPDMVVCSSCDATAGLEKWQGQQSQRELRLAYQRGYQGGRASGEKERRAMIDNHEKRVDLWRKLDAALALYLAGVGSGREPLLIALANCYGLNMQQLDQHLKKLARNYGR